AEGGVRGCICECHRAGAEGGVTGCICIVTLGAVGRVRGCFWRSRLSGAEGGVRGCICRARLEVARYAAAIHAQLARNPPLRPAKVCQSKYRLLEAHFESVHLRLRAKRSSPSAQTTRSRWLLLTPPYL